MKKTKLVAFYLPQFHAIPENDKAWGEGFTEWDNVKKGKKFRLNQYQPHVPLNNNYYSLLDLSTMQKQAELHLIMVLMHFVFIITILKVEKNY